MELGERIISCFDKVRGLGKPRQAILATRRRALLCIDRRGGHVEEHSHEYI